MRRAFLRACVLDVAARKPGNVSVASAGHRMRAGQFLASARAAAAPLFAPRRPVGERIEGAVRATLAVAGCNTNLGIVLLCAPLAAAGERWRRDDGLAGLRAELEAVLQGLDRADAQAAYRAIALARPAGLGRAPRQDVADAPTVGLREAMALAAGRDRIAHQYAHAYADVFDVGLPAFEAAFGASHEMALDTAGQPSRVAPPGALSPSARLPAPAPSRRLAACGAMQRAFLEYLAAFEDSHIVRKHGAAVAHSVMAQAVPWRERARCRERLDADPAFAAWDEALKSAGINPGTSADLCVATALLAGLHGAPSLHVACGR